MSLTHLFFILSPMCSLNSSAWISVNMGIQGSNVISKCGRMASRTKCWLSFELPVKGLELWSWRSGLGSNSAPAGVSNHIRSSQDWSCRLGNYPRIFPPLPPTQVPKTDAIFLFRYSFSNSLFWWMTHHNIDYQVRVCLSDACPSHLTTHRDLFTPFKLYSRFSSSRFLPLSSLSSSQVFYIFSPISTQNSLKKKNPKCSFQSVDVF